MIADQLNRDYGSTMKRMDPSKFAMWLFIIAIIMQFVALTSAYIAKRNDINWIGFELPYIFYFSTLIILISSISIQTASYNAKKNNIQSFRIGLLTTLVLGFLFLLSQFMGWKALIAQGDYLVGYPSSSFCIYT